MNSINTSLPALSIKDSNLTDGVYMDVIGLGMKVGMTIAYVVTFLVGLFGNAIGMYVVYKRTCIASVTNLFIANMALADLLVTLLAMPTSVVHLYIGNKWIGGLLGTFTCKLTHFSLYVSLAASVFTVVFISIERYVAIFFPLRGDTLKSPKIITGLIWVLSFCFASPVLIMFTTEQYYDGNYYCLTEWPGGDPATIYEVLKRFFLTSFVILYICPILFLGCVYSLISFKLCVRTSPENTPDNHRAGVRNSRKKVVKLLIVIVVVFSVCWFPAHVMHYLIVYELQVYVQIQDVALVSFWLCQANSSINPCLYVLLNESFRQDFGKVVMNIIKKARKGFRFDSSSCTRRRHGHRHRSNSSSASQTQQRRLSFMQLLQAVRGTFSSSSARLTAETKLTRNSLTVMNHGRIAADTRF